MVKQLNKQNSLKSNMPDKLDASEIKQRRLLLEQSYRRARNELDDISRRLNDLKKHCKHNTTSTYYPDPSGNNDSSYKCDGCGSSAR